MLSLVFVVFAFAFFGGIALRSHHYRLVRAIDSCFNLPKRIYQLHIRPILNRGLLQSIMAQPAGAPRPRRRRLVRNAQPASNPYQDIHRIEVFKLPFEDQYDSPLFGTLPSEVRDIVYEYAFTDYEDLTRVYDLETCYRRPDYMGPRKTDTALLRTCQAVYNDAWYLPWTLAQHTFFLTTGGRKPTKTTEAYQMAYVSNLIEKLHPEAPARRKQIQNIQIFSQLYILEPGNALNGVLQIPHFMPRTVTITIRHTDIWWWENDHQIHINTPWVKSARFPTSTNTLRIQLESLERRKPQIDYVADRAQKEWFFIRADDVHLVSTSPPSELRWTGSSTWQDSRWLRDEDDREPGILHYYVSTLTFIPANKLDDAAGYESRNARQTNIPSKIEVPFEIAEKTLIRGNNYTQIHVQALADVGVTNETPASEAVRILTESREDGTRDAQAQSQQPPPPQPGAAPVANAPQPQHVHNFGWQHQQSFAAPPQPGAAPLPNGVHPTPGAQNSSNAVSDATAPTPTSTTQL